MLVRAFHFLPLAFRVRQLTVLCVLMVLTGTTTQADPIPLRITSGGIEFSPVGDDFKWDVAGRSFSLFIDGGIVPPPEAPFRAPYNVGYSFETTTAPFGAEMLLGSERLSFPEVTVRAAFSAPLQPLPSVEFGGAEFQFPFTITAAITGTDDISGERFSFAVSGQGRGIISGTVDDGRFLPGFSFWKFEPTAPIPEPSTILLLSAAGLAGLVRRKHIRTRGPAHLCRDA